MGHRRAPLDRAPLNNRPAGRTERRAAPLRRVSRPSPRTRAAGRDRLWLGTFVPVIGDIRVTLAAEGPSTTCSIRRS